VAEPPVNPDVFGGQFAGRKRQRAAQAAPRSLGLELLKQINEGAATQAPPEEVEKVRVEIIDNCEELIEIGARIRPLMDVGQQIGWVRGVHFTKRKTIRRWIKNPDDYILHILLLATTFSKNELEGMQAAEIHGLANLVHQMSEYDTTLFPYLPAYATTQSSEDLWNGKGESLTSFENRIVAMPDGKEMRILAPPSHARVWASLCTYREQEKRRLQENFNALFIVRPWAGRNADPIQTQLNGIARTLETDSIEPWQRVVKAKGKAEDGWAHPGDSVEDLLHELKGMVGGDRHERVMDKWAEQIEAEAKERTRKIVEQRQRQGITEAGIVGETTVILTEAEVKRRQAALRSGKPLMVVRRREDAEILPIDVQAEKIRKYR